MNGMKQMNGMSMSNKKFKMSAINVFDINYDHYNKVAAIKAFRALTNHGIKTSKEAVERCWSGYDSDNIWTILTDKDRENHADGGFYTSVDTKDQLKILRDNGIKVDLLHTDIIHGIYLLLGQALDQNDFYSVRVLTKALVAACEPYDT